VDEWSALLTSKLRNTWAPEHGRHHRCIREESPKRRLKARTPYHASESIGSSEETSEKYGRLALDTSGHQRKRLRHTGRPVRGK